MTETIQTLGAILSHSETKARFTDRFAEVNIPPELAALPCQDVRLIALAEAAYGQSLNITKKLEKETLPPEEKILLKGNQLVISAKAGTLFAQCEESIPDYRNKRATVIEFLDSVAQIPNDSGPEPGKQLDRAINRATTAAAIARFITNPQSTDTSPSPSL